MPLASRACGSSDGAKRYGAVPALSASEAGVRQPGPYDPGLMDLPDLTGFAAATLTTASFVPQVVHTWRTRDLSGISLAMYAMFTLGVALWLVYGIAEGAWPVIVANFVTLLLAASILAMKVRAVLASRQLPVR